MVGNSIGHFLEYDGSNKGSLWLNYMCVGVELDVTKPLKHWKFLKLANGNSEKLTFQYERLNLFCFLCGMLYHTGSYCDKVFNAGVTYKKKGWGLDLQVTEWGGRSMTGDWWLREGENDGDKFAGN